MPITKKVGRQDPLYARVEVTFEDIASGVASEAIDVPAGAIIVDGYVNVTTAFDSGTSDVLDVGDGDDDDRFTSSQIDISSTGATALDLTGHEYAEKDTIDVTWTAAGTAATAGVFELVVAYIREDRAVETQT